MDEHLTWNKHVTSLTSSLVKFFGIFKKLRDSISRKLAIKLYYSFLYSRINYGIQVYGTCSATLLKKVQTISNKLLKYLLKMHYRTPTVELHKELKILLVKDIREVNTLSFVRNCLFNKCPAIFKNYYEFQQHSYHVRAKKLKIAKCNTNLGSSSIKLKGASLWNVLDKTVKDKAVYNNFKKS